MKKAFKLYWNLLKDSMKRQSFKIGFDECTVFNNCGIIFVCFDGTDKVFGKEMGSNLKIYKRFTKKYKRECIKIWLLVQMLPKCLELRNP